MYIRNMTYSITKSKNFIIITYIIIYVWWVSKKKAVKIVQSKQQLPGSLVLDGGRENSKG